MTCCASSSRALRGLFAGDARAIEHERLRVQTTVLLLGCFLAPIVIIALPSTPIFGGTKHWFTAYPFMVLFAGLRVRSRARVYARLVPRRPDSAARARGVAGRRVVARAGAGRDRAQPPVRPIALRLRRRLRARVAPTSA